jgi:hypothetical protein
VGAPATKHKHVTPPSSGSGDVVHLTLTKAQAQNLLIALAGALGPVGGGKKKKKKN